MRKRIIDWIFTLQSQRGILGEKERRLYTYAYGLLLNKIAIYAIIAIVGTITGNWIGMFSFLLPFTILRQYAGGIHLEKPMNCIIFSGFLVFGCGQYLAVASDIGKILCALWVAAILLIFVLAPIDTKGKKLDKTAKKIYGRRARGVLVIEVMIAICFWVCGFIVVTKGIAIAHIILMVSLITGKENNGKGCLKSIKQISCISSQKREPLWKWLGRLFMWSDLRKTIFVRIKIICWMNWKEGYRSI